MYHDDDTRYPAHARRSGDRCSAAGSLRTDPRRAWLGGVCAGIGRHFALDPMLVRIVVVLLALWVPAFTLGGYVAAWLLMRRG